MSKQPDSDPQSLRAAIAQLAASLAPNDPEAQARLMESAERGVLNRGRGSPQAGKPSHDREEARRLMVLHAARTGQKLPAGIEIPPDPEILEAFAKRQERDDATERGVMVAVVGVMLFLFAAMLTTDWAIAAGVGTPLIVGGVLYAMKGK